MVYLICSKRSDWRIPDHPGPNIQVCVCMFVLVCMSTDDFVSVSVCRCVRMCVSVWVIRGDDVQKNYEYNINGKDTEAEKKQVITRYVA